MNLPDMDLEPAAERGRDSASSEIWIQMLILNSGRIPSNNALRPRRQDVSRFLVLVVNLPFADVRHVEAPDGVFRSSPRS